MPEEVWEAEAPVEEAPVQTMEMEYVTAADIIDRLAINATPINTYTTATNNIYVGRNETTTYTAQPYDAWIPYHNYTNATNGDNRIEELERKNERLEGALRELTRTINADREIFQARVTSIVEQYHKGTIREVIRKLKELKLLVDIPEDEAMEILFGKG